MGFPPPSSMNYCISNVLRKENELMPFVIKLRSSTVGRNTLLRMATSLCDEKENLRDLPKSIHCKVSGWEGCVLGERRGGLAFSRKFPRGPNRQGNHNIRYKALAFKSCNINMKSWEPNFMFHDTVFNTACAGEHTHTHTNTHTFFLAASWACKMLVT